MKKLLLVIAFLFAVSFVRAQSQRLVLCEEFTQASCPPCATQNPAYNELLNINATKVVSIKYQTSWPGVDPMNAQNPTQVATRVSYYTVSGVPDGSFDASHHAGQNYLGAPANANQAMLDSRYAVASPFLIDVSHYLSSGPNVIHAHSKITCSQAVTGTLVAHMAIIERNIYFATAPGSNGETHFEGVMKQMLPTDQGTTLASSWAVGQILDIDLTWNLANVYDTNQLAVVVWIQDNTSKEVLQAGYSAPNIPNDAGVTAISGMNGVACNTTLTPSVTLTNFAVNPLTSCSINYTVDAGSPITYSWSGNIAQGGTAVVALAPVTVTTGTHTLAFSTSMPNGSADLDIHNDAKSTNVFVLGIPVAAPLVQGFVSGVFPPAGWSRENIDADAYQWMRASTGFNGAGSAEIPFWYALAGTVDNLYTPLIDFTGAVAGSSLSFDVAHAQYNASYFDRLMVQLSIDCGATWTTVYDKVDPDLATTGYDSTAVYTPTAAQWRHETVSLNAFIGEPSLLVRFHGLSGYGNNAYVDNVNIDNTTLGLTSIAEVVQGISVFPNPSNGDVFVKANFSVPQDITVTVTTILGAVVKTFTVENANGNYPLNLKDEPKGNYFVSIKTASENIVKRITVTE